MSAFHHENRYLGTHLARIIVSSSCRLNLAVSLLLTNMFSSMPESIESVDRLCTTRSSLSIFDVAEVGSKAAGSVETTDAGEGASNGAWLTGRGPSIFLYLNETADPYNPEDAPVAEYLWAAPYTVSLGSTTVPLMLNSRWKSVGAALTAPAYEPDRGAPIDGPADSPLCAAAAWFGVAMRVPSGVLASTRDPSALSALVNQACAATHRVRPTC